MLHNPMDKPKDLLRWLQTQSPNPWPTCDANKIGKIMGRIRIARIKQDLGSSQIAHAHMDSAFAAVKGMSLDLCPNVQYVEWKPVIRKALCSRVVCDEWMPSIVRWDMKISQIRISLNCVAFKLRDIWRSTRCTNRDTC